MLVALFPCILRLPSVVQWNVHCSLCVIGWCSWICRCVNLSVQIVIWCTNKDMRRRRVKEVDSQVKLHNIILPYAVIRPHGFRIISIEIRLNQQRRLMMIHNALSHSLWRLSQSTPVKCIKKFFGAVSHATFVCVLHTSVLDEAGASNIWWKVYLRTNFRNNLCFNWNKIKYQRNI